MSLHQSEIVDEATYVKYAESFVFDMQRSFRNKAGVEHLAVIEMCMMLEELCFNQAMKEKSIQDSSIWANKECVLIYQRLCEKLLRNLESKDHYNWNAVLIDHDKNPKNVQFYITKDDDGRTKKTQYEIPYKPPREKASRTGTDTVRRESDDKKGKKKSGGGNLGSVGGGRSKKKVGGTSPAVGGSRKRKATSAAGLITATVDWMKGMTAGQPTATSAIVAETAVAAAAPTTSATYGEPTDGDFNLDMDLFDDPTLSMSFVNAEALSVLGGGGDGGDGPAVDQEPKHADLEDSGGTGQKQGDDRDLLDEMDF